MGSYLTNDELTRSVVFLVAMGMMAAAPAQSADTPAAHSIAVDGRSFRCIRQMTPVRHFYVDNLLGQLDAYKGFPVFRKRKRSEVLSFHL